MYSNNKDLNKEVKKLVAEGWSPIKKGGNHWQIRSLNGTVLTIASSPGDVRTLIKFKSDVKRVKRSEL